MNKEIMRKLPIEVKKLLQEALDLVNSDFKILPIQEVGLESLRKINLLREIIRQINLGTRGLS